MYDVKINDMLKKKALQNNIPLISAFELSPVCNFSCSMCYVRKTLGEVKQCGGLLPADWWIEMARQGKNEGLLYPLLTGGEPFLYTEIERVITELSKMGMLVTVNTNASLITEKEIEWLLENPPLRLNITLYGASDESYGKLCGDRKGFTKVKKAVELLMKNNINFRFNSSIVPQNQHELKAIIDYGKSVDHGVRVATYMFPPTRRLEDCFGQNDRMTAEEAGKNKVLTDYYQLSEESFERMARYHSGFIPLKDIDFDSFELGGGESMQCMAGRTSYWIDWQGNLSACGMLGEPKVSLKEKNFAEAWKQVVKMTQETKGRSVCLACPNRMYCHTCIATVHAETGDLHSRPKYFCEMMEATSTAYRDMLKK